MDATRRQSVTAGLCVYSPCSARTRAFNSGSTSASNQGLRCSQPLLRGLGCGSGTVCGQWVGQRLRFAGEASATPEREGALSNLLNIIGRRNGARSLITLG